MHFTPDGGLHTLFRSFNFDLDILPYIINHQTKMKQTFITSIILLFCFTASAQFKGGVGASFQIDGTLFGLAGKGHYTINDDFAGQTTFTYYFNEFSVWSLDFDAHYAGFDLNTADFIISPFAGLNIYRYGSGLFSVSSTNINLGVNGTKEIGSLELFIEPKISLGNGSSVNLSAGVYF